MSMREQHRAKLDTVMKTLTSKGWEIIAGEIMGALELESRRGWTKSGDELIEHKGFLNGLAVVLSLADQFRKQDEEFDTLSFADEPSKEAGKNELED